MVSAANELHGSQGAQEQHRGDTEGVHGKPMDRNDRVIARGRASMNFSHGLYQALVEQRHGVIALASHSALGVLSLQVSVRAGGVEGVVGQSGVY
jgi:hypothetical protein